MESRKSQEPSPRTLYAKQLEEEEELLIDLTMNFEPLTISLLKKEFENNHGQMNLQNFVVVLREHLRNWRPSYPNREKLIVKLLVQLFREIDMNGNGTLEWDEFTNYIIEKATTISALKKNRVDAIKNYSQSTTKSAFRSDKMIEKLINMESIDRIGIIEDFSNIVKFYNPDTGQVMGRDLVIKSDDGKTTKKDLDDLVGRGSKRAVVSNALFLPEPDLQILLTSCNDGIIRSWKSNGSQFHSANHEASFPLLCSKAPQKSLAWDSTSRLLYSGDDVGCINLWKYQESKKTEPVKSLHDHDGMVTDLIAVPKLEFLISCSQDKKVILWDMISTKTRRIYTSHTKGVLSLAFNQEYRLLFSAGFDHDIYVWNPYIDSVAFTIEGHNSSLVGVKVIPDSHQVISADIDGWVKVWDIRNLSCAQTFNLEEKQSGFRFALSDFTYLQHHQRLVFGGKSLTFYDYDKNHNPYLVDDNLPLAAFYTPTYHKILTPISNKVKVWNALTALPETLYAASAESEISFVEMDDWEKRMIVGDIKGRTRVYNIKNGALMKALADHKGEINCVTSNVAMAVIVTASLDMNIMVHDDKELTETKVLKVIDVNSVVAVVRLVPLLDLLLVGNNEGEVLAWDLENACYDGVPMKHTGEIVTLQVLHAFPLFISADSVGEIAFWALHPLPFKYQKLLSIQNQDPSGFKCTVQAIVYNKSQEILYTADERGYIKALNLSNLTKHLNLTPLLEKAKENKTTSTLSKSSFNLPVTSSLVVSLFEIRAHNEGIRHLFLIKDPAVVMSTGYDRRVKLVSGLTGRIIGALQQGIQFLKARAPRKESEAIIPWNFDLDVRKLAEKDEKELEEMCWNISLLENTRKSIIAASLHFKGLGPAFIEPQMNDRKGKGVNVENKFLRIDRSTTQNLTNLRPMIKNSIDTKKAKQSSTHTRKQFQPGMKISKVPSLPSIIQAYRADSTNIVSDMKKKLSKAAFRSAVKLSQALDEMNF
jgi:WD40 repeat protein